MISLQCIGFDRRRSKIEDGFTGEELDRIPHLKIRHINKVLSQIHDYDI